jgi:hypothetical protein
MTEPKRWSSSNSEIDPVLRSVLLYARDLQPDSRQLQTILRGAAERRPAPKRRRFVAVVLAFAAACCAGGAWAGYASGFLFSSPSSAPSAPAPSAVSPAVRRAPPRSAPRAADSASAIAAAPAELAASPSSVDSPALRVAPSAPRLTPSATPEQDTALLQQARLVVAADPARALTLTRDHELHFPASALTEERQALRIEALARLGRHSEATRDLSTFDRHFPRSIYRHRLHALLPN